MSARFLAAAWILAGACSGLGAQSSWLPPRALEGLAQQTVARIEVIRGGPSQNRARAMDGARRVVRELAARVDSWGEKGVLQRTPSFLKLRLPVSGNRHLDAMARIQACNWATTNQQSSTYDTETRVSGALAAAGVTMAVAYLRDPYLKAGGKREAVEAFLTGPAMDREFQRVMSDRQLMGHVEQQCQPMVTALFSAAQ